MYIEVLVEIKAKNLDKTFTYKVPSNLENEIEIGKRVLVPFGNQKLEGFILNIVDNIDFSYEVKDIIEVIDEKPVLNDEMILLGKYIKEKTLCNLINAYSTMLPTALKAKHKTKINKKYDTYLKLLIEYNSSIEKVKSEKQQEIISLLKEKELLKKDLTKISTSAVNTLIKNGIIGEIKKEIYRIDNNYEIDNNKVKLTEEQKNVYDTILNDNINPYLLHGVTGSGKTEVYMSLIEHFIFNGKEAIVLVPEISLTPQIVNKFRKRFGNKIAILHSGLSNGEKYDEWRKIEDGKVSIAIGARSCIFAPFKNLGIIIIDEEHSENYKQENNPKYNAIDIALFRKKYHNATLVLGSATPSIESYTKARLGIYTLVELKNRVNNNLPKVSLIDMKYEYRKGNSIISEKLKNAIDNAIKNNHQVMLLLNRRGYTTISSCKNCGHIVKCPNCDIPLIYHKNSNNLRCHYCGYAINKVDICPECKSKNILDSGLGTERLEQYIAENISGAKTIRMDIDTTSNKGALERIINDFESQKYNILIGTQMISKGLDFGNVTVVGVINSDQTLNIPDFRSSERTFELLNQVAGRAGRGNIKGEVFIQGFNIDHYSIVCASLHDYKQFYDLELDIRKKLRYSPYYNLCLITLSSNDLNNCFNEGNKIVSYLKGKNIEGINILGPSATSMPKINNIYFVQIMIKYKKTEILKKELLYINDLYRKNKVKVEIDLNPIRI